MLLGGRTAEELIFDEPTTGAANDIEKATEIARAMVTEYGMSDLLGPQQLGQKHGEVFLGRDFGHQANYSDEVAASIDAEVRRLIDEAQAEALAILRSHRAVLDVLYLVIGKGPRYARSDEDHRRSTAPWSGRPAAALRRRRAVRRRSSRAASSRTASARSSEDT